jgi:hypothetical protein
MSVISFIFPFITHFTHNCNVSALESLLEPPNNAIWFFCLQVFVDAKFDRRVTCDGIHPMEAGNRAIAGAIVPFMQRQRAQLFR